MRPPVSVYRGHKPIKQEKTTTPASLTNEGGRFLALGSDRFSHSCDILRWSGNSVWVPFRIDPLSKLQKN